MKHKKLNFCQNFFNEASDTRRLLSISSVVYISSPPDHFFVSGTFSIKHRTTQSQLELGIGERRDQLFDFHFIIH